MKTVALRHCLAQRRRITWALLLTFGLVLSSCGSVGTAPPVLDRHPDDFVRTRGRSFTIAGQAFRFVGFNLYNSAAAGQSFYSCLQDPVLRYTPAQLDSVLAYVHREAGVTVLRFWAYQTYTASATRWSGVDEVIRLARANGMRVLPVIEDGPGHCTTGPPGGSKFKYEGDTWYSNGYKTPFGTARLSYPAYVAAIVTHYRNDPTILGWEMMNEATTAQSVDARSAVVGFARTTGTLIHSIDHHHLVTVGTESDGWPGASGTDYGAVYGLPQIDFGAAHDYQMPGQKGDYDPFPMNGLMAGGRLPSPDAPGCQPTIGAPLACSVAEDLRLGKPMVIDEVAVPARSSSRGELMARARLFDRKFAAGFANGVSGEIVWDLSKVDDAGAGNLEVLASDHDPLIGVMKRWSGGLP